MTSEVTTAAQLNTHIRDNENFLRGFHGGRMWESAALSQTANAAFQLVTWDTTDYDTDSFAVLGSEWFVVPSGFDGYYRAVGVVQWAGNATGIRQVQVMKNETYTVRAPNGVGTVLAHVQQTPGSGSIWSSPAAMWQGPLVAGDHLTLEAFQSSGGNLAFTVGKSELYFELHYLGS